MRRKPSTPAGLRAGWNDRSILCFSGRDCRPVDRSGGEPIERIVACAPVHQTLLQECSFTQNIDEFLDGGFWSEVSAQWPQTLRIADQVQAFRKLCVHSEFLCLVAPHIYGGSDDETDLAAALIQPAMRRPSEYSKAFRQKTSSTSWSHFAS